MVHVVTQGPQSAGRRRSSTERGADRVERRLRGQVGKFGYLPPWHVRRKPQVVRDRRRWDTREQLRITIVTWVSTALIHAYPAISGIH